MRVIGLTGGIGSGKSSITALFESRGVHAVDADTVAREVVEPGQPALERIADHFGREILDEHGALDRAALRRIVFEHPGEREWLEQLLHPIIRQELMHQLWLSADATPPADYEAGYVLLVSPLLLETDQNQLVESIIVVDVPVDVQIERTMARDANDRDQVDRIVAAQMDRQERLNRADFVIDNSGALDEAESQVTRIHQQLSKA